MVIYFSTVTDNITRMHISTIMDITCVFPPEFKWVYFIQWIVTCCYRCGLSDIIWTFFNYRINNRHVFPVYLSWWHCLPLSVSQILFFLFNPPTKVSFWISKTLCCVSYLLFWKINVRTKEVQAMKRPHLLLTYFCVYYFTQKLYARHLNYTSNA